MAEIWSVAALAGLWGWIACTVAFTLKGFPENGIFRGKAALPWGGALLFFFLLWMLGMSQA